MLRPFACVRQFILESVCLGLASAVAAAAGPQQTGLLSVNATGEFTTRLSVAVLASSDTGGGRGGATGTMTPLSLATADLNHDGYPDLIVGYAAPNGGLLKIHFANPQAFAPDSAELVQEIAKGQFPPTFLNSVSTIPTSAAPDLLAAGDFSGTGAAEILYATRGGSSLIRLAADSIGRFREISSIAVPGRITALAASKGSIVIGTDQDSGPMLLTYRLGKNSAVQTAALPMTSAISQVAIADLDGDRDLDVAVVSGGRLFVLHGINEANRLEPLATGFTVESAVPGDFIADHGHKTEVALLADDGSIHVWARGQLKTGALAPSGSEQLRGRARQAAADEPGRPGNWNEAYSIPASSSLRARRLFAAHLSRNSAEELLAADSEGRLVLTSSAQEDPSMPVSLDMQAAGEFTAAVSMRLNVMGSPGLVMLAEGGPEPLLVAPQPNLVYHVTALTDSTTGTCTVPSGSPLTSSCTTLRAAVAASNALYGENLIVFDISGTVTLTASGPSGIDEAGHLDVTNAVTIVGNGAAQTIIQAGTNSTNGIDKVFSFNPLGQLPGFAVSISGLTIQYGRNTFTNFSVGDNEGGAFDFDASAEDGAGSLSIANCAIAQNSTVNGDGGGIALFDGGVVTITGTTFSGNTSKTQGATQFYGGGIFLGDASPFPVSVTITNSTMTGNAAADGGGGIYVYGPGLAISGSRLIGNTSAQGAQAIDGAPGNTVAATNNWWGSNTSPAAYVNASVATFSPWLVMTFAASPTTVAFGQSSTLAASISTGSNGSTGHYVADGTPVSFTGSLGTLTPTSAVTLSGAASSAYAATAEGSATVTATVDSQTLSATLTLSKATPAITWSNPAPILFGGSLGSGQLNATASVPGSFVYTPPAGTVLLVGNNQKLSVQFTPTDTTDYTGNTATVEIDVTPESTAGLITTETLARDPNTNDVIVTFTIANSFSSPVTSVQVTSATLASIATLTTVPLAVANVPAGGISTGTLTFPGSVGSSGSGALLHINGSYSGGSFGASFRAVLP